MINERIIETAEKLGWDVYEDPNGKFVDFGQYSPAGEDFSFSVSTENLIEEVKEYAADFDVDEHVEMWIEAKRNGVSGVPTARVLVEDAEDIDELLHELAIELAKLQ